MRGDGQAPLAALPAAEQLRAINALLASVRPATLLLPEPLLATLPPRPAGLETTRELFARRTGIVFDALAPAEAAASLTFQLLLHPQRVNRLVQQHARDPRQPGLADVLTLLQNATWGRTAGADFAGEIQRVVNYAALRELLRLGANEGAGPQVQAIVTEHLSALGSLLPSLATQKGVVPAQRAHLAHGQRLIERFLADPREFVPPPAPPIPPGQPIGSAMCESDAGI